LGASSAGCTDFVQEKKIPLQQQAGPESRAKSLHLPGKIKYSPLAFVVVIDQGCNQIDAVLGCSAQVSGQRFDDFLYDKIADARIAIA
jgi:hypothetical protein